MAVAAKGRPKVGGESASRGFWGDARELRGAVRGRARVRGFAIWGLQMNCSTTKLSRTRTADRWGSRRRRLISILAAMLLAMIGMAANSGPAQADDGPFIVDGAVPDAGATELPDLFGNVKELGPKNANTTKIGVIHNAAVPMLDTTNPNGQVDLRRAWLASGKNTADANNPHHDWLYFAWERDANSGSGFIAFEFMQDPAPVACDYTRTNAQLIASCNPWANRRAGDFMILWDQQGGSLDLFLRTWSGTAPNLTLGAPVQLNAAVSEVPVTVLGIVFANDTQSVLPAKMVAVRSTAASPLNLSGL
jgi:hypothetical protein